MVRPATIAQAIWQFLVMRTISALLGLLVFGIAGFGQPVASQGTAERIIRGPSLPATCIVGDVYYKTTATIGFYECNVANTWTVNSRTGSGLTAADVANVPAGTIAATTVQAAIDELASEKLGTGGTAALATALAANGANCSGNIPRGVDASGAAEGCADVDLTSEVTGVLPNGNTTAASANTASAIVTRDGSGDFAAGTITAALTGNASTSSAFAADPAGCTNQFTRDISAAGVATCASVVNADIDDSAAIVLSKLATQAADTVVLNATGGAAVPTAVAMPTGGTNGCAGATDAITYNTTTHALGCNQITGGAGDAAATEAVTYGATPTFTMASNTLDTKTMTLTGNVTSCTIAAAEPGQDIKFVLTASGATRTFACASISGLGTLSIADTIVCTVTARATSATAAAVVGPISCPNGNNGTFIMGGTVEVTFPAGTYSALGTAITNTFGAAGTLDASAMTSANGVRVPNIAGGTPSAEGAIVEDTTNDNLESYLNGVAVTIPAVLDSAPLVDGECVEASIVSSRVRLAPSGGACGGGGTDPTDLSIFTVRDNFCGSPNYTYDSPDVRTSIGDMRTWWNALGTTDAGITFASTPAHPCVMVGTTTAASSNEWYLVNQNSAGPGLNPSTQTNTTTKFVFSIDDVTSASFGFSYNTSVRSTCDSSATNCIGVYYVAGTDSFFRFRTCSGGSCGDSASTIAPSNGTIYTLVMSVTASGTWSFAINGETAVTRTTTLANATLYPAISVTTNTAATRAMSLYGFTFQRTGITF